jgi:hypothetical protein
MRVELEESARNRGVIFLLITTGEPPDLPETYPRNCLQWSVILADPTLSSGPKSDSVGHRIAVASGAKLEMGDMKPPTIVRIVASSCQQLDCQRRSDRQFGSPMMDSAAETSRPDMPIGSAATDHGQCPPGGVE